ncbi:MAG: arginyltransferase [Phycisphaerae bacterium]
MNDPSPHTPSPLPAFCHYPAWPPPVRVPLTVVPEHPCPYLPGRQARERAFLIGELDPEIYHDFMDAGFRRSGRLIYQPACRGCRACVPLRVPTATFRPSRSQRRVLKRNEDLTPRIEPNVYTAEKFDLYARYVKDWHARPDEADPESFRQFLYDSPVRTLDLCWRDPAGVLVGLGVLDVCSRSASSVYFYFDPAQRQRTLGTFSACREILWAAELGLPHYYLGYWVKDCRQMAYKASFSPAEVLDGTGTWRPGPDEVQAL